MASFSKIAGAGLRFRASHIARASPDKTPNGYVTISPPPTEYDRGIAGQSVTVIELTGLCPTAQVNCTNLIVYRCIVVGIRWLIYESVFERTIRSLFLGSRYETGKRTLLIGGGDRNPKKGRSSFQQDSSTTRPS